MLTSHESRVNHEGSTALHLAAEKGHTDVIKHLLKKGARVDRANYEGFTALHLAAKEGHIDITKHLMSKGAKVNKTDKEGYTPLHLASNNGRLAVVNSFLLQPSSGEECSQDICVLNEPDERGCTAVHLATRNGHSSVVQALVSHGADLNIQSQDGQTCLYEAIKLCYHADTTVESLEPLQKIAEERYQEKLSPARELLFFLLENGATVDVEDKDGKLPIQYARDEVVQEMILSRLQSMGVVQKHRERESSSIEDSVTVKVGSEGEKLGLKYHGVYLCISPGTLPTNEECEITVSLLKEVPAIDIQDDETLACYGFRFTCNPPNTTFSKPVIVTLPHSAVFINPGLVIPEVVSRMWDDSKGRLCFSRTFSSTTPDVLPFSRISKEHLDLYIDHCADWWVLLPLKQHVDQHKLLCTPYISKNIKRRQEIDIRLCFCSDIPGNKLEMEYDENHDSFRRAHPSISFLASSRSGNLIVTCDCNGEMAGNQELLLDNVRSRVKNKVIIRTTPKTGDGDISEITISVTQGGKRGTFRFSLTFVIRHKDDTINLVSGIQPAIVPANDRDDRVDHTDAEVLEIAERITVDQFYNLGVALGFQINQIDVFEYSRLKDRQHATYDMLRRWIQKQEPGKRWKVKLQHVIKSAEEIDIPDLNASSEIEDKTLVDIAGKVNPDKFLLIGRLLGFTTLELEHIQHRAMGNVKDSAVQLLSRWKASLPPGPTGISTLKRVWESVKSSGKRAKFEDHRAAETKQTTHQPAEEIDRYGGIPSEEDVKQFALSVKDLSSALKLGKALLLDDSSIAGICDILPTQTLQKIARQIIGDIVRLGSKESKEQLTRLVREYNVHDIDKGRDEIPKRVTSIANLLHLTQALGISAVDAMLHQCRNVAMESHLLLAGVLRMLNEWKTTGGTRRKLLETAQKFHFVGSTKQITASMNNHPGFEDFCSHGIIHHKGAILALDDFGIRVTIPPEALEKGKRFLVTLQVSGFNTPTLSIRKGEVLITPVVECSSICEELMRPATVVVPHCLIQGYLVQEPDIDIILYTKNGLNTYGRRKIVFNLPGRSITNDMIEFDNCHLQLWAIATPNVQGVRFRCAAFQPLFMPESGKPTIHVHIFHPFKRTMKQIQRHEVSSPAYCQVDKEAEFSLELADQDLTIFCEDGKTKLKRMVPIRGLLIGSCTTLKFELKFSPSDEGRKHIKVLIRQRSSTLKELQLTTSIETTEPNYGRALTDSRGREKSLTDKVLDSLTNVLQAPEDVKLLGYKLGFSHSSMESYLSKDGSSTSDPTKHGLQEMIKEWRRRVRPIEQLDSLRKALHRTELGPKVQQVLPPGRFSVAEKMKQFEQ